MIWSNISAALLMFKRIYDPLSKMLLGIKTSNRASQKCGRKETENSTTSLEISTASGVEFRFKWTLKGFVNQVLLTYCVQEHNQGFFWAWGVSFYKHSKAQVYE